MALSEFILAEFKTKLHKKFQMPQATAESIAAAWRAYKQVEIVIPIPVPLETCRAPNDCVILGTAQAAQADYLVTGDRDLLVLGSFEGIQILSPKGILRAGAVEFSHTLQSNHRSVHWQAEIRPNGPMDC